MQQRSGPLFVHCIAAMERLPGLSRLQPPDYLLQVHPGTMPQAGQRSLLDQLSQ